MRQRLAVPAPLQLHSSEVGSRGEKENLIERRRVMAPSRYWQFPVTGEGKKKGGKEGRKPQSGLEKKREGRLGLTDARMRKEGGGEGGKHKGEVKAKAADAAASWMDKKRKKYTVPYMAEGREKRERLWLFPLASPFFHSHAYTVLLF